jgi:DNA invertase Pin-like site-specific DNA recombinase
LFEKYGVDFISVTERFDTSTPSGRLLRNIMLTFAQFERELASERTKDKMPQRAQKGMWNGGLVPFGYKSENKKLVICRRASSEAELLLFPVTLLLRFQRLWVNQKVVFSPF